jgi:hypothetical protein
MAWLDKFFQEKILEQKTAERIAKIMKIQEYR